MFIIGHQELLHTRLIRSESAGTYGLDVVLVTHYYWV